MGIFGVDIPSDCSAKITGAFGSRPRIFTTFLVLTNLSLFCATFYAYVTRFTMNLQIIAGNGFVSRYK